MHEILHYKNLMANSNYTIWEKMKEEGKLVEGEA